MSAIVFGSPEAAAILQRERLLAIKPKPLHSEKCGECDGLGDCECGTCGHYGTCPACEGRGFYYPGYSLVSDEVEAWEKWLGMVRAAGVEVAP